MRRAARHARRCLMTTHRMRTTAPMSQMRGLIKPSGGYCCGRMTCAEAEDGDDEPLPSSSRMSLCRQRLMVTARRGRPIFAGPSGPGSMMANRCFDGLPAVCACQRSRHSHAAGMTSRATQEQAAESRASLAAISTGFDGAVAPRSKPPAVTCVHSPGDCDQETV